MAASCAKAAVGRLACSSGVRSNGSKKDSPFLFLKSKATFTYGGRGRVRGVYLSGSPDASIDLRQRGVLPSLPGFRMRSLGDTVDKKSSRTLQQAQEGIKASRLITFLKSSSFLSTNSGVITCSSSLSSRLFRLERNGSSTARSMLCSSSLVHTSSKGTGGVRAGRSKISSGQVSECGSR